MRFSDIPDDIWVNGNGLLTERIRLDDGDVVIHYDDIPDSDTTVVNGLPCTTVVRSIIDVAPELDLVALESLVRQALDLGKLDVREAFDRVSQPDMHGRLGAALLAEVLLRLGYAP